MRFFNKKAFTLSEVLLALAVVGIIAAMVVPGLMNDANKKMLTTQLKNTVVSIQDLAQEQIASSPTKTIIDTDFVSTGALLSGSNFDVIKNCSSIDKCWGDSYKSLNGSTVNVSQSGIQLKNGVAIYYVRIDEPESYPYSDTNDNEHYFGIFYVDVNGTDKPNLLGRDLFIFNITDKGRIGDNLANDYDTNTKTELKAYCQDYSEPTACLTYLELNGWNMDY